MSPRGRRLIFAATAVLVVLGAAEGALRLAGFEYQPIPERIWLGRLKGGIPSAEVVFDRMVPGLFERDPLLFWAPVPGKPPFNRQGLRDDEDLPPAPAAGEIRVLALGDSCTFLGEPRPWTELLEDRLRARGGAAPRVLNAGVPAYSSLQGLRRLESRVGEWQPDVVMAYFGWNDHWRATIKPDAEFPVASARVVALQNILSRLRLYQALNRLLKGPVATAGGEDPRPGLPGAADLAAAAAGRPYRVPLPDFEGNLREMVAVSRAAGARMVLITAPTTLTAGYVPAYLLAHGFVAKDGEPVPVIHAAYVEAVRRVAAETGAVLVDAAADFAAAPDGGRSWMRDDGIHLTAAGMARLADLVASALAPSQGPPPSAASPADSSSR